MHRAIIRGETKSKSNSRSGSRSNSRPPSRGPGENDLLSEINFDNIDQLISERLNALLADENENTKVKYKLNSIPDIIQTLQKPLKEVNSTDRELLLTQLYNLIIKNTDLSNIYLNEDDYENDLVLLFKNLNNFKNYESNEYYLLLKSVTSFIIINLENSSILYSEDKSLNILNYLEKKIKDDTINSNIKKNLIYSYSILVLSIFDESGGFGIENHFEFLQEFLISNLNDIEDDFNLIISILYGLGSILTLLINNPLFNEYLENLLDPDLFDILNNSENLELLKPVSMLFGFSFENYNYNDDINEDLLDYIEEDDFDYPFQSKYQLIERLNELFKNSSKKISKRDKKEGRSVFKDVLNTIEFYSDKRQRIKKLSSKKKADEIEVEETDDLVLSHIKLSKSRSLAVKSWFAFFRLIQFKWLFTSGLHNQLANNKQISSIIRDKPVKSYSNNFNFDDEEPEEAYETKKQSYKKKQKEIEMKRMEKLTIQLNQSGLQ